MKRLAFAALAVAAAATASAANPAAAGSSGVLFATQQAISNFARSKPPRAYAGVNPQSAARSQQISASGAQPVQVNTQTMGELQNTERELIDAH
jgi:hypothetical protein